MFLTPYVPQTALPRRSRTSGLEKLILKAKQAGYQPC